MTKSGQSEPEFWTPATEGDREAVRLQLERVLRHPLFTHSQRYPALLRYVVEQAVAGTVDHIKERTIGVLVFGRDPSYDANADPVVRVTAGQIRKRLSQYYSEPEHQDEIRILLPIGSYVPQFLCASVLPEVSIEERKDHIPLPVEPLPAPVANAPVVQRRRQARRSPLYVLAAAFLVVAAFIALFAVDRLASDPMRAFWGLIDNSRGQIVLSIQAEGLSAPAGSPGKPGALPATQAPGPGLAEQQIGLAIRIAATIPDLKERLTYKPRDAYTFENLRSGPVILIGSGPGIGGANVGAGLEFAVVRQGTALGILDRRDRAQVRWIETPGDGASQAGTTYATIARYFDSTLGQPVVLIAGTSAAGTAAGVELVTDRRLIQDLTRNAPSGWQKRNLEAVIEAKVVGGYPGAPSVVATRFW